MRGSPHFQLPANLAGEAPVEAGEIHAHDHIGPTFERQRDELIEQTLELPEVFQDLDEADNGVLRHVEGELDASAGHLCAARAEELNGRRHFLFQRRDQFRREQIAAGLAGDEHERCWFHAKHCSDGNPGFPRKHRDEVITSSGVCPPNHLLAFRGRGTQVTRLGSDADPSEIESVGIPTGLHGCVAVGKTIRMQRASLMEECEIPVAEFKRASTQLDGEFSASATVVMIAVFVEPAGVVEDGEQLHNVRPGPGQLRQPPAGFHNPRPMNRSMHSSPGQPVLGAYRLDERNRNHHPTEFGCA